MTNTEVREAVEGGFRAKDLGGLEGNFERFPYYSLS